MPLLAGAVGHRRQRAGARAASARYSDITASIHAASRGWMSVCTAGAIPDALRHAGIIYMPTRGKEFRSPKALLQLERAHAAGTLRMPERVVLFDPQTICCLRNRYRVIAKSWATRIATSATSHCGIKTDVCITLSLPKFGFLCSLFPVATTGAWGGDSRKHSPGHPARH